MPILDQGRTVGAVRVTQSNAAVSERVRRNVLVVVGVGLAALALGLGLAWVLPARSHGRCARSRDTARRVEDGELDARAEVTGAREQQEVAIAFNEMTDRLGQVLEAQREFVGNASHQLRTPLTGLRLRLEAAGLKSDDAAVRHELELAEAEVERLTRLLNSLLTLARDGDRPTLRTPPRFGERPSRPTSAGCRAPRRPGTRWRSRATATRCSRRRRGRRDHTRQPDRERARLRAGRDDGDGDLGSQRPSGGARRRPWRAAGRGAPRLRAVPPRPQRPARHRARPGDRRGAGAKVEGSASISTRDGGTGTRAEVVLPLAGAS